MSNHLKTEIRVLLISLRGLIKKLPPVKQTQSLQEIENIVKIPDSENEKSLQNVLKNLRYKSDFLRMTNPSIAKTVLNATTEDTIPEGTFEEYVVKMKAEFIKEEEASRQGNPQAEESTKTENTKDQNGESDDITSGKYVMKDGKLKQGEAPKRKYVEFSNWYAANVDPEDLKKHKELLDRQHFRGPFWEGKKLPTSIMDEKNPIFNMDVEPEANPNIAKPKKVDWETVKR